MSTPVKEPKPTQNPAALVPLGERGIMLKSLDDLLKFAKHCVENGAAPKGMTPGAAAIAIQAGLERGLSITSGLQFGTVINGKFGWNGQGVLALIRNSPACKPGTLKSWVEGEGPQRKGVCVAHRVGYAEPFRREFSMADAKKARLDTKDGPWKEYTDGQLEWRAIGSMGKFHFSDVLGGFPTEWELRDHPEMTARVVSPAPAERAALPPPVHDPLSDLFTKRPEPEGVLIEAKAVREAPAVVAAAEDYLDDEPEELDHAEADKALAEQERLAEEKRQQDLEEAKRLKRGGLF